MTGGSWTWLTDHWRLKLLAVLLALVLFGAVAFAQNPITVRTISVRIDQYQINNPELVLVNYPSRVDVQLLGLANAVNQVSPDDVRTVMDLTKVQPPAEGSPAERVKVDVNAQVAAQGVTLQQSTIPLYVTVDRIATKEVKLQVLEDTAPGLTIDKTSIVDHSTGLPVSSVTITGPASLLNGIGAFVNLGSVQGSLDSPNEPVQFKDAAQRLVKWPPPTIPQATLDIASVDITITAHQNYQHITVSLLEYPTGQPACGYEIGGISFSPSGVVTLTGTPSDLAKVTTLTLNPIDVTGATSNVVSKQTIPLPSNLSSLQVNPTGVTVTISIKQATTCTPASPVPSPLPTPT